MAPAPTTTMAQQQQKRRQQATTSTKTMTTANNKNNNNKTTKSITKTAQKTIRMNLVAVEQAASCKKLYKKTAQQQR